MFSTFLLLSDAVKPGWPGGGWSVGGHLLLFDTIESPVHYWGRTCWVTLKRSVWCVVCGVVLIKAGAGTLLGSHQLEGHHTKNGQTASCAVADGHPR